MSTQFVRSLDITTTNLETFTGEESCRMAALIFKHFGRDPQTAANAWRRLHQNSCTTSQFMTLVVEAGEQITY